jgi:hypothetical protein
MLNVSNIFFFFRKTNLNFSKSDATVPIYILFALSIVTIANPARAATLTNTEPPSISGTFQVGSTIAVDPGAWNQQGPITFSYTYQICSASGTNCTKAPGLFAKGPRPTLLLVSGTEGKRLKVKVTATSLDGRKSLTTSLSDPIAAYPNNAAPLIEFINGFPDAISYSSKTTFQFQPTGTGVTLSCKLDNNPFQPCPTNNKITYDNLTPGSHQVKVKAENAYGSTVTSHSWTVESLPDPVPCPDCYKPPVGTTWQWQLNPDTGETTIDTSIVADMYDIDGFDNSAAVVSQLKSLPGTSVPSRGVTCYITAGTLENFRADSDALNPQLLGNPYAGFPDERWIDIRAISQLDSWLGTRLDMCKSKGFDAVEFDNVDGWSPSNRTGLNLTFEDEIAFIAYFANEAHERGLSVAHKSNVEQIPEILDYVDFAVVEECFQYKECTRQDPNTDGQYGYDMFIEANKPVFEVEYKPYDPNNNVCDRANALGFSTLYKKVKLDSYRVACSDFNNVQALRAVRSVREPNSAFGVLGLGLFGIFSSLSRFSIAKSRKEKN